MNSESEIFNWKSILMPTLGEIAKRSDRLSVHCYNPDCQKISETHIGKAIADLGRDAVFADLKYRLCCPKCKSRNISVSASNDYTGSAFNMTEQGAVEKALLLDEQGIQEGLTSVRSRIRARLAGGHIREALFWSTVRGVLLGLRWKRKGKEEPNDAKE